MLEHCMGIACWEINQYSEACWITWLLHVGRPTVYSEAFGHPVCATYVYTGMRLVAYDCMHACLGNYLAVTGVGVCLCYNDQYACWDYLWTCEYDCM